MVAGADGLFDQVVIRAGLTVSEMFAIQNTFFVRKISFGQVTAKLVSLYDGE